MGERTTCAIAGGGPAGMVLGLLLARAGVDVTVFEKHPDFLRDFRGDTVHPVTMRLLDELGLGERFAALPKTIVETADVDLWGSKIRVADFRRLRQPHPYLAMVPQWDLLDLLADAGRDEPTFTLRMSTEVTGLLRAGDAVTGVRYRDANGDGELLADLTVACDGRSSLLRREAGLTPKDFPAPFDVWWFRVARDGDVEFQLLPRGGRPMVLIPREGYYQAAYLIPKGSDAAKRARGLDAFVAELSQELPESAHIALTSWDEVKVLDVLVNRLHRWSLPGLLCIGDAAHAMSPVAGVGINLAVADAVATARLLAEPLRTRTLTSKHLAGVRRRRVAPTVVTQTVQRIMHARVIGPIVRGENRRPPETLVKAAAWLFRTVPALSGLPAYAVGVGLLPEHAPDYARRPPLPTQ